MIFLLNILFALFLFLKAVVEVGVAQNLTFADKGGLGVVLADVIFEQLLTFGSICQILWALPKNTKIHFENNFFQTA